MKIGMKKAIAIFVLGLAAGVIHAQHIAVSNDKQNIFYIGIPNPITVVAEN
jgi:hypothetical protein